MRIGKLLSWVLIVTGVGFLAPLAVASPCMECAENVSCLGECAYRQLLQSETPSQQVEAYLTLAYAWLKGDLTEGVPRLLHEALRRTDPKDSLAYHAWHLLAQAHYKLGRVDSATLLYEKIAAESQAYPFLRARAYLALGSLYATQEPLRAQGYIAEATEIVEKHPHPLLSALIQNLLAYLMAEQGRPSEALSAAQKARQLLEIPPPEAGHPLLDSPTRVYAAVLANLASLYAEKGNIPEAINVYQDALAKSKSNLDTVGIAHAVIGLARLYLSQKKAPLAANLLRTSQSLYRHLPYALRREWLQTQTQLFISQGQVAAALDKYQEWVQKAEKEARQTQSSRIAQLRILSGLQEREAQVALLTQQQRRERLFYGISGVLGLLTLGGLVYAIRQTRRRAAEERSFRETIATQAQRIQEQAHQLERQNQELTRISEVLTEALATVQDSYMAARRLQRAILPPLERLFPGSAVYYEPMHGVGGDFYTAAADPFSGRLLLVVGDCTGHGISGTILSGIMAATLQNLFLQNPSQRPKTLLARTHQATRLVLQSEQSPAEKSIPMQEGADLAVLIADFKEKVLHVGLAGRPLWYYDPLQGLQELDGGRRGLDSFTPEGYEFPTYALPLSEQGTLYLFTDGVSDVLNTAGKKWGIKELRRLLTSEDFLRKTAADQREALLNALKNWRGQASLNDDATFIILPFQALWAYAKEKLRVVA